MGAGGAQTMGVFAGDPNVRPMWRTPCSRAALLKLTDVCESALNEDSDSDEDSTAGLQINI